MSGMSDIVFLLLIFFMITSTLIIPAAQNVELPESNNQTQANPVLVVSIDINKTVYVDDQAYGMGELESVLRKKLENYGEAPTVRLNADRDQYMDEILTLLDIVSRRGLISTIVYHTLLVLLLVFAGLTFPDPPPEEEGILVNFGTDETGLGDFEPMGDDQNAGDPELPVVEESQEFVEEVEPVQEPVQAYTPPDPTPVDNTQDVEETQVKEDPKPTAEEIERERQKVLERQRQAEIEKQRLEQERIERELREEQERNERERQQQAERLNTRGRNAFGRQGGGETISSDGSTEVSGNQGVVNGSPDADRYDTGGGLGDGITVGGMDSRKVRNLPKPNVSRCEVTQRIEVTVEIQVDRQGKVISAIVSKANYQDNCIWTTVAAAAKLSSFSEDLAANYRQTGTITYIIVP